MKELVGSLLVVIMSSLLLSCQSEIDETIGEDPDAVITSGSEMAMWIQRASANNGESDNFLDEYSCGTVKFPVAVTLNGAIRMINDEGDLRVVERIIGELGSPVFMQFPITIESGDYSEVKVNSEEDLEAIRETCTGGLDDRIACINFQYPVEMLVYNANNQSSGGVTIRSDREFYLFIEEIGNLHTSINYPVKLEFSTGEKVQISTNSELMTAIKQAKEMCDTIGG